MKRRYRGPVMPQAQRSGEYCTIVCANQECRLNLTRCQKGEKFTVRRFYGTERCRGYQKP